MKKYYLLFCLVFSHNVFALNTTADWVAFFNQYKDANDFGIAQSGARAHTDFYAAMETYSNRTALAMTHENTFEDFAGGLNILISMYEATGDLSYLAKVLQYSENLIGQAHVLNSNETDAGYKAGMGYKGWYQRYWKKGVPSPNTTEEIKPFRYMLKMCRIIAANASLSAIYQTRVNALVAFIEKNVWQKWSDFLPCNEIMKRKDVHITCNWTFVATDLESLKNV